MYPGGKAAGRLWEGLGVPGGSTRRGDRTAEPEGERQVLGWDDLSRPSSELLAEEKLMFCLISFDSFNV